MNYSENQRTGRLAELDVEHLFTSWGWIVGHDHIDEGYDLNIEPDRSRFKGARFLVQVKGTARSKGKGIVAPVSKKRLRQYAENPIPVVIVRSVANGTLYWIHAQEWARTNFHKLSGHGDSGVRLDKENSLSNRGQFEDFLRKTLAPPAERTGAVAALAQERSNYLSSLDARLLVRTSVNDGKEQHEIFATSHDVSTNFKFQPSPKAENIETLRDAIEFGLPGEVDVEEFQMSGSPVFDAIGASEKFNGRLAIQPTTKNRGLVRIRPGLKYSMFAPELTISADLFRGQKGAAISNTSLDSLFDVRMKLVSDGSRGSANVTIGVRSSSIYARPIQYLADLSSIADWAEALQSQNSMFVELHFLDAKMHLSVSGETLNSMHPFLSLAGVLGKLHLVAKALNSSFTVPEAYEFSASDLSDINLAFALLKGERHRIEIGPIEFDLNGGQPAINAAGPFFITTAISFELGGQLLGEIPVGIELSGFTLEHLASPEKFRLSKEEHGQAWISFHEHEVFDAVLTRR